MDGRAYYSCLELTVFKCVLDWILCSFINIQSNLRD